MSRFNAPEGYILAGPAKKVFRVGSSSLLNLAEKGLIRRKSIKYGRTVFHFYLIKDIEKAIATLPRRQSRINYFDRVSNKPTQKTPPEAAPQQQVEPTKSNDIDPDAIFKALVDLPLLLESLLNQVKELNSTNDKLLEENNELRRKLTESSNVRSDLMTKLHEANKARLQYQEAMSNKDK